MPTSPSPTPTPTPSPTNTPFGKWDPGGCNCVKAIIGVEGCCSIVYPGVTVSVYTSSGGTLLYSGVTDSNGEVHATVGTGNYWVAITGASTRFASYAATTALVAGGLTTIKLTPAAGYICAGLGCLVPTKTALNYTGPSGNLVLTWNGTSGWFNGSVQFISNCGTASNSTYILDAAGQRYFTGYSCPPSFSVSFASSTTVTE